MGVPKGKKSKSNCRSHRAGLAAGATAPALSTCPQCHAFRLPHHACPECGAYDGKTVKTSAVAE